MWFDFEQHFSCFQKFVSTWKKNYVCVLFEKHLMELIKIWYSILIKQRICKRGGGGGGCGCRLKLLLIIIIESTIGSPFRIFHQCFSQQSFAWKWKVGWQKARFSFKQIELTFQIGRQENEKSMRTLFVFFIIRFRKTLVQCVMCVATCAGRLVDFDRETVLPGKCKYSLTHQTHTHGQTPKQEFYQRKLATFDERRSWAEKLVTR